MLLFEIEDLFKILSKEGTIDDFVKSHKEMTKKEVLDFLNGVVEVFEKRYGRKKDIDI